MNIDEVERLPFRKNILVLSLGGKFLGKFVGYSKNKSLVLVIAPKKREDYFILDDDFLANGSVNVAVNCKELLLKYRGQPALWIHANHCRKLCKCYGY